MLNYSVLLAAITPDAPPVLPVEPGKPSGAGLGDILMVAGVVVALALLLFIWVYFFKKKNRRHYTESGAKVLYKAEKGELDGSKRRRRHRRPNHPDNLPRNPTLAEAGGLPPIRPDEPVEPTR